MSKPRLLDLAHGHHALISEEQWPLVRGLTVYLGKNGYAYFSEWRDGKSWPQLLHRRLVQAPPGSHVDHINGDKLDNRLENLRVVTPQINQVNRKRLNRNNTSGFRGVVRAEGGNGWKAQIMVGGRGLHLGIFQRIEDAIRARREAEIEHFGELCP